MRIINRLPNKKIKIILLESILILLAIFLIETIVRAWYINPELIDSWGYNPYGYGDLLPNKNFIAQEIPQLPYQVITNSFGFRNSYDISIKKPNNLLRILAVGDSFTFGPYVNNQDTYPAKLEFILRKTKKIEVLNAGVSGYTLADELEYLQEKGFKLEPDIIIIGIYENDVLDYLKSNRNIFARKVQQEKLSKFPIIYKLAKKSALLTLIEKNFIEQKSKQFRNGIEESLTSNLTEQQDSYYADLDKLLNLLDEKQKIIFVLFPSFGQISSKIYFPQANIKNKINKQYSILDLRPIFRNNPYQNSLYLTPLNGHLSSYGNQVVAEEIAKFITK